MTQTTVNSLIAGSLLAVDLSAAQPLLNAVLPKEATASMVGAQNVERGQRYVVANGVAVVPVRGVLTANSYAFEKYLGWTTYHGLVETMQELSADSDVNAIVPIFDTPGGNVLGIHAGVDAIRSAAKIKPVHGLIDPLAASAGYWLASQCTDLALTSGSWVGSVGAMSTASQPVGPGFSGEQKFIQTSAHAGAKRPDPSTDEGKALIQARLDSLEVDFHAAIEAGRGFDAGSVAGRMSRTESDADGGDVFWGADALERQLVDTLETRVEFMERIVAQYMPSKPKRKNTAYLAEADAALALSQT